MCIRDRRQGVATAISLKELKSGAIFVEIVFGKHFSDPWTAMELAKAIEGLGYKRVTLRCDQEPSIIGLAKRIKNCRDVGVDIEYAPRGDSNANGLAERGVRDHEGQLTAMYGSLMDRLGERLHVNNPTVSWMVRQAADLKTKMEVRKRTGKTAYEYLEGRRYRGVLT